MIRNALTLITAVCISGSSIAIAQDAAGADGKFKKYVGSYEQDNIDGPIRVTLRKGHLTALAGGRPPIRMIHVSGHKFRPENMPDATIVFKVRKGRVVGYTFKSPEETNVATRIEAAERKAGDVTMESKTLNGAGVRIKADFGRLVVPENRAERGSNLIELAFVRLKSTADEPRAPLVYLAGGPGSSATFMADNPRQLQKWAGYLDICDVVLLDQRGTGKSSPSLRVPVPGPPPIDLFRDRESALNIILDKNRQVAAYLHDAGVDVTGYTTVQSADDLDDLRKALGVEKISLLGFSYGTHLAQAAIKRHGEHLENVIICGVEGLAHTFKLPSIADTQFRKIALLAASDPRIARHIPDLVELLERVYAKLEREPLVVELSDPRTGRSLQLPVGKFGLQLILRFDLGDASDIPVFPKLLYTIDKGDPSVLRWFVRKRFARLNSISAMTWVMDGASGASPGRWERINAEAKTSLLGNVMNFPHPQIDEVYGTPDLGEAFRAPIVSGVRTLFLTGTLDWNTPPYQAEQVRWGFVNATHIIVENAGHEQVLPQPRIQQAIKRFLKGEDVRDVTLALPPLRFVPIDGYDPAVTHPSVRSE